MKLQIFYILGIFLSYFDLLNMTTIANRITIIRMPFRVIENNRTEIAEEETYLGVHRNVAGNHNDVISEPLKVSIFLTPPFIMYDLKNNQSKPYGMMMDIFEIIVEFTKLQYEYIRIPANDFAYGSLKNGSWNGLIKMLADKNVNLTLIIMAMNEERRTAIDYSWHVITTQISVAIMNPLLHGWNDFQFSTYIEPFSINVWLILLAIAITFHILSCITKQINNNKMKIKNFKCKGRYQEERSLSSRWIGEGILFISFNTTKIIITSMYLSKLTSVLIVRLFPYGRIDDLLNSGYLIGTIKDAYPAEVFKTSKSDLYSKIWRAIEKDSRNLLMSTNDAMRKLQEEKFAFIWDETEIQAMIEDNCEIVFLKKKFIPLKLYLGFQKKFPYTDIFNKYIRMLTESGLMQRMKKFYLPSSEVSCTDVQNYESIHLNKVISAFIFLLAGLLLSLFILSLELLYSTYNNFAETIIIK